MSDKRPKCAWCDNQATRPDYRTIDGMTSKIPSCDDCFEISTKALLKRKYPPKPTNDDD